MASHGGRSDGRSDRSMYRLRRLERGEHWFELASRAMALFAGILVVVMMFLMLGSMIGRNVRITGVGSWCQELSAILVAAVFLFPMGYVMWSGGMIRVDFFVNKTAERRPSAHFWLEILVPLSCVLLAGAFLLASTRFLLAATPGTYYIYTKFPTVLARLIMTIGAVSLFVAGLIALRRHISKGMGVSAQTTGRLE